MKNNFSIVPRLLLRNPSLGCNMARAFWRMGLAQKKTWRNYGYNHMKDLCLVYFKLTPLCNLRCVMCGQRGDKGVLKGQFAVNEAKTVVPLEQYKKLIDELDKQKPIIYLWGGEPFLYPDLIPLAKYCADKGFYTSVNTNGTLLEEHAEEIVRDKWSTIFVSLDAFSEVNDRIRGQGSYEKVVRGFDAINREKKKQGSVLPTMGVTTTVTNMNYQALEEFVLATKSFDIDWHIFNLGTYTNDAIVARQKQFMRDKLDTETDCLEGFNTGYNDGIDAQKLYETLQRIHDDKFGGPDLHSVRITVPSLNPEKIRVYYDELETPVRNHCVVPWCQTNINYNGDVHYCADYPDYILGNIKDSSFADIYNGDRANRFREALNTSEDGMFPGCLRCYQNMLFGRKVEGF